jgi:hypothetical protein
VVVVGAVVVVAGGAVVVVALGALVVAGVPAVVAVVCCVVGVAPAGAGALVTGELSLATVVVVAGAGSVPALGFFGVVSAVASPSRWAASACRWLSNGPSPAGRWDTAEMPSPNVPRSPGRIGR